ncbi:MAG: putative sugar nucleotidyl transferase [Patescibacteria group bacterium]
MRIVLFNDNPAALFPFTHLKSPWEIDMGGLTLRKWVQAILPDVEFIEQSGQWQESAGTLPYLVLNGRLLPSEKLEEELRSIIQADDARLSMAGEELAYGYVTEARASEKMAMPAEVTLLHGPWEIIKYLPQTLLLAAPHHAQYLAEVRPHVFAGKDVELPPTVVTRTDDGPIVIGSGTTFESFIVLEGPAVIGEHCIIRDHACIKKSAIGNVCRIGGEVEWSVMGDYTNKQHYGYVGHSVVAPWVNLGAGTTTSDLKHTYGSVRVDRGAGKEETGMQFCGSFIGEGARTSVNTTLMTGTVLGVSAFVFGTARGLVPSFTSATAQGLIEVPLEVALRAWERAMARRGVAFTPHIRDSYTAAFERTAPLRGAYGVLRGAPLTL